MDYLEDQILDAKIQLLREINQTALNNFRQKFHKKSPNDCIAELVRQREYDLTVEQYARRATHTALAR